MAVLPTQNSTSGGSSERDVNEFAVIARMEPLDFRRDDGDAGRELPDGLTEGARIDGHRLSVPSSYTVVFFMIALTSIGLTRSDAVQPSRLYSAMHCSAKPL